MENFQEKDISEKKKERERERDRDRESEGGRERARGREREGGRERAHQHNEIMSSLLLLIQLRWATRHPEAEGGLNFSCCPSL